MSIFWRILIALVVVIALNLIIPPFFNLIGFPLGGDLMIIIRVCIAAIAILYIMTGNRFFPGSPAS